MKIAISLEEFAVGGGPKFALSLGQGLVAAGHQVTCVTERRGEWWDELAPRGLEGYCLPCPSHTSTAMRSRLLAQYLNGRSFDVVLVNEGGGNETGQLACHFLEDRIAAIPVFHGDWQALYDFAERDITSWNCGACVGTAVYEGALHRFPNKPIFLIENGVDRPRRDARRDWELPLRLLFVGRVVDSHKGVFRLPAILAACRARGLPVTLTVLGDGEDHSALAKKFSQAGVDDLVNLVGAQSPAVTLETMRSHHLLIFPTNMEGLPLSVLEAQAAGCVPIATRIPGVTEIAIEDYVTGILVERGDIGAFVRHIESMLDPDLWRKTSAAAIDRLNKSFSIEKMCSGYMAVIEDLARGAYPLERPYNRTPVLSVVPFDWWHFLPRFNRPKFAWLGALKSRTRWLSAFIRRICSLS